MTTPQPTSRAAWRHTLRAVGCLVASVAGCTPGFTLDMERLSPSQGLSLRIPAFEVPYGQEVQDCYFLDVPALGGDVLWVSRVLIGMRPGSHHFNAYRVTKETPLSSAASERIDLGGIVADVVRGGPCLDSSNFNEWPLVVNSQHSDPEDPYYDWELPPHVAFPLRAGERIMLQPHYVNVSAQETPFDGEVAINFYRSPIEDPIEMGTLFATQQSIRVCQSNPEVTYDGTCSFPAGASVNITAVNGHFHLRGKYLSIAVWDGVTPERPSSQDVFYESTSWGDPVMATDLEIPVPEGGGIWWTCQYAWARPSLGCDRVNALDDEQQGDCCYTFGAQVSTQEHCNVFLYYWPKVGDTDIFCN